MQIHDHFDGMAHCIECAGPCELKEAELLATKLIRYLFESWAAGYPTPNMMLTSAMKESGINFERFKARAQATVPTGAAAR